MPVVLRASDNQEFTIERAVAERSPLLKDMLEDIGEADEPIPLPNISGKILEKVIEYCDHHKGALLCIPENDKGAYKREKVGEMDEWDATFVQVNTDHIFEIILAANYLDIRPLVHLGCRVVAEKLKPLASDELRKAFDFKSDYTEEEEELLERSESFIQGLSAIQPALMRVSYSRIGSGTFHKPSLHGSHYWLAARACYQATASIQQRSRRTIDFESLLLLTA
ncbi:Skp1 family, tetramerization domain-containing protein [Gaertneriomyces semiglobifer]|nr:Skp1 family, tetramerization domain-containing protein [Gaertneriomyces semiglobifer]